MSGPRLRLKLTSFNHVNPNCPQPHRIKHPLCVEVCWVEYCGALAPLLCIVLGPLILSKYKECAIVLPHSVEICWNGEGFHTTQKGVRDKLSLFSERPYMYTNMNLTH